MKVGNLQNFKDALYSSSLDDLKAAGEFLKKIENIHQGDDSLKTKAGLKRRRLELLQAYLNIKSTNLNASDREFVDTEVLRLENTMKEEK